MIILLTPTMLASDIVTAARYKMAQKLQFPMTLVTAQWLKNENGGLDVKFDIDLSDRELGLSEDLIRAVIQTVWTWEYKRKLEWTLENVRSVRPLS